MKNTISCGRSANRSGRKIKSDAAAPDERRIVSPSGRTHRDKRERAASALLLFGAMICTLWLCHFPDRRAVGAEDDRGASALSEYEVIEVFGEFGSDSAHTSARHSQNDDGWTLSGYFKEFFSALLGV